MLAEYIISSIQSIFVLVKISASGIFGVIKKTFLINLCLIAFIAFVSISLVPPLATITGSKIILETFIFFNELITALMTFTECNIPILIASGLISLELNSI